MLTRRRFLGCALCAAVAGFEATDAGAQTPGLKRTLVSRLDGPVAGYETIEMKVDIDAAAIVGRHTHFGIETSYVVEGALELAIDGLGSNTYTAGQGFQVPAGVIHGGKAGDKPITLNAVFVVEKGKPLATPA